MSNNINKTIAHAIVKAQIASNSGKVPQSKKVMRRGLYTRHNDDKLTSLSVTGDSGAKHHGYGLKTVYVITALKLIRSNKTNFNYYIESAPDQRGNDSIIVYFETKVNDERIQISFHTPMNQAGDLLSLIGTGRKTRWNRRIGGSIADCQKLIDFYNL
jgi:hypothetical protein